MSNKLIPGLSVNDGFDFVKKIWGTLPIPSAITPTTDLDELEKRINDLKAVEQWLNINLSMLRATIQGLEVQRGTIATIKSFGANFVPAPRSSEPAPLANAADAVSGAVSGAITGAAGAAPAQAFAAASGALDSLSADAKAASAEATANLVSGASAWWGLLQDQITKVAGAALSPTDKAPEEKKARPLAGNRPPIKSSTSSSKPRAASTSKSSGKAAKPAGTKPSRPKS